MKVLHIITYSKTYTYSYTELFTNKQFDNYDQKFLVISKYSLDDKRIPDYVINISSPVLFAKNIVKIITLLIWSDKIIFSGMFFSDFMYLLYFIFVKKSYILFWGGDFYSYNNFSKFRKIIYNLFVKNTKALLFQLDDEYDSFVQITKIKHKNFVAPFPSYCSEKFFNNVKFIDDYESNDIYILLGNSATKENQHFDAINKLLKYKNNNIKIICPLNYGDKKYALSIAEYGKNVFGNKFLPITEWMEPSNYYEYINKCCIAIFNNNRQQAQGNIYYLIKKGCKIYMQPYVSTYKALTGIGIKVYDINMIENYPSNDFFRIDNAELKKNNNILNEFLSKKNISEAWLKVFED